MKPSPLTLTAGIFILALFGCVRPPTPPQGGVAGAVSREAQACSLSSFLSNVHYLTQTAPPFSLPGSGFQNAPPIDSTPVSNANITQDLTDAFNTAPDFFKIQLCKLTSIYIDRTGCSSYDPTSCTGPDEPLGVGQQGSWLLPPTVSDTRWVSCGLPRNYHKVDDVDMTKLGFALNNGSTHGTFPEAGDLLYGIFSGQLPGGKNVQNGRWASALAAFSTDEDCRDVSTIRAETRSQTTFALAGQNRRNQRPNISRRYSS